MMQQLTQQKKLEGIVAPIVAKASNNHKKGPAWRKLIND